MEIPINEIYKIQNQKLLPATFKRGIISKVNLETFTADVYIIGNPQTILKDIPMSSAIDSNEVQAGQRCRIDMFDESNKSDMVVAYTY